MRIFFLFLFILTFSSCTLLSRYKESLKTNKKENKSSIQTTKPKKISFEFQIVNQTKKEILSGPLTNKRVTQLKKLLKNKQLSFLEDQIKILLGQHFLKKRLYKKALFYYSKVNQNPWRKKALLEKARIYYQIDKPKKTLKLINILLEEDLKPDFLKEVYLLKLSLVSRKKPVKQAELLEIYCYILNYERENTSIYRKKARHIVFNMKETELLDIKSKEFIEPIKDLVFFRIGKILFYRENFNRSFFFLKKFLRFSTESHLEEKALKYIQSIESRKKVNRKHIGAILPLTGPSQKIGERSLKGLKMGLGFYTEEKNSFKLIVIDSQGQPDKAKKAVQKLVTKHHVIAIVGGILSRTAQALAEEAQNFGVPALLMSQKSKLTNTGHFIFQNGFTASLVANQLTQFLISKLKIKRFAILYPNDSYGVDYANAFWSAVEKKGGEITGAQFYKSGETDFNGPIRRLIGTYYLKDRLKEYKNKLKAWYLKKNYLSKRKTPENILTPIVNFEVLFIPDSIKIFSLIASHIAYNDIKNIQLAGPSLWNKEKILKKHSKYIDRITFTDMGFSTDKFKQTSFYKQFDHIFNYEPGLFEIQAYESTLVLRQIIASGVSTRNKLREELNNLKTFHGPTGKIIISNKRTFLRSLPIFKMEQGILSSVYLDF